MAARKNSWNLQDRTIPDPVCSSSSELPPVNLKLGCPTGTAIKAPTMPYPKFDRTEARRTHSTGLIPPQQEFDVE